MPEKHRFPMRKYRMTRQALQADPMLWNLLEVRQVALPAQFNYKKTPCPSTALCLPSASAFVPMSLHVSKKTCCKVSEHAFQAPQASKEELAGAHCIGYVERFLRGELNDKEMRSIGFPWSEGLVRRSRASAGGTLAATRALLEWNLRITANIAGLYSHPLPLFCQRPSILPIMFCPEGTGPESIREPSLQRA